jgi:hypothetical protein
LLFAQAALDGGQKFVPFNTNVVDLAVMGEYPVTFQHLPQPELIQLPPPNASEIAAAP